MLALNEPCILTVVVGPDSEESWVSVNLQNALILRIRGNQRQAARRLVLSVVRQPRHHVHSRRLIEVGQVEGVHKLAAFRFADVGPYRDCVLRDHGFVASLLRVKEECSKSARHNFVREVFQQTLVVFESFGALSPQLPESVQKLNEDGRPLGVAELGRAVAYSLVKLVSKRAPVFLYQYGQTIDGAVVRVKADLRQAHHLCCPIPSIRAVHQAASPGDQRQHQSVALQD
mmetsp:Transcript_25154/g.40639  ORF Transcript_25154/g.40639 Transcript_25154/m.40639 type:complete len:230 (-) Transcript_25154:170-859(-)